MQTETAMEMPLLATKMSKTFSILQKKLQELESDLLLASDLPFNTPSLDILADEFQQRFVFFRNLLRAETASHPSKPFHLLRLEERFVDLETTFRHWDSSRKSKSTSGVHDDDDDNHDHIENYSVCSSCLNDDDDGEDEEREGEGDVDGEGSSVYQVPEMFYEAVKPLPAEKFYEATLLPTPEPEETFEKGIKSDDESEESGGEGLLRKECYRFIAIGVMVAAILISSSYQCNEQEVILKPT